MDQILSDIMCYISFLSIIHNYPDNNHFSKISNKGYNGHIIIKILHKNKNKRYLFNVEVEGRFFRI